jgi:hypothetical protein
MTLEIFFNLTLKVHKAISYTPLHLCLTKILLIGKMQSFMSVSNPEVAAHFTQNKIENSSYG